MNTVMQEGSAAIRGRPPAKGEKAIKKKKFRGKNTYLHSGVGVIDERCDAQKWNIN